MNTTYVTPQQAADLLYRTNGLAFSATFVKRTNGELRTINGRLGVSKGVTGKGMSYDPESRGLLVVWSFDKDGFRMIPLDALVSVVFNGEEYQVVPF